MRGKKQKEPAGMNPAEIFAALELLEKERGIPQTFMMEKIIQAITTAYKRDHEGVENVIVDVRRPSPISSQESACARHPSRTRSAPPWIPWTGLIRWC